MSGLRYLMLGGVAAVVLSARAEAQQPYAIQDMNFDMWCQEEEHLPPDRSYLVESCRITAKDDFKPVRTVIAPGAAVHLSEALPPPAVELVTVRTLAPHEKPALRDTSQCDAQ